MREGKSFSILMIKKDREDLHFLKKSLEENPIFPSHLDLVANFDEALAKFKKRNYHMLLLESAIEEETKEVLEKIHTKRLALPFVLLLPIKDDLLFRQAVRCGVADVIVKSESQFHELAEKLRNSYRNFHKSKNKRVKMGNVFQEENPSKEELKKEFSVRDELTGLYSHGYLYERVVREFSQATRYGYPISCIMIDLDDLKKVNEEAGYFSGEKILKEVAQLLFENCRMSDFVARYSGKEFCMVLPHSGYQGAKELAGRLKKSLENHVFLPEEKGVKLNVSIGVSSYPEDVMTQRADLIRFAAEALLHAKSMERNRVSLFKEMILSGVEDMPTLHISDEKVAAFHRRISDINNSFRKAYLESSKALILALEAKDKHTAGHSASTAKYAFWTALEMGMSREEAESVRHGTLLHDIGKICIPDQVLLKPGRLSMDEFEIIKQHAMLGYKMIKPIKFLQKEALVVLHHHEWFNGEGYPFRLKGNEIPLGARIAAVADTYDTIRAAGVRYKRTLSVESTIDEIIACAGTQFDPEVIKAFISVLKNHNELVSDKYNQARLDEFLKLKA